MRYLALHVLGAAVFSAQARCLLSAGVLGKICHVPKLLTVWVQIPFTPEGQNA